MSWLHKAVEEPGSKMSRALFLVIGMLLLATFRIAFSAEARVDSLGPWTDGENKVVYAFLANNEFIFSGEKKVCVKEEQRPQHDKIQKDVYDSMTRIFGSPPCEEWKTEPVKVEGAWKTGTSICWLGDKRNGQKGNLMVYVDRTQCCFNAEMLGKRFMLSLVWQKETKLGICTNRLLTPWF